MVRAVCLPATDSHQLHDAQLGNYHQSELTLAGGLCGLLELITLFDRTQFSAAFLLDWQGAPLAHARQRQLARRGGARNGLERLASSRLVGQGRAVPMDRWKPLRQGFRW